MRTTHDKAMAEIMNRLPEVQWDRFTAGVDDLSVYGWIARSDGRSDFVILDFEDWEGKLAVGFNTSSAELSEKISERLFGKTDAHEPCQRVEFRFGELVGNVVRL